MHTYSIYALLYKFPTMPMLTYPVGLFKGLNLDLSLGLNFGLESSSTSQLTGHPSPVSSESDCRSRGREFHPDPVLYF